MKNRFLKGIAAAILIGSTVALQAVPINGSIGFNANFVVNNPNLLLVTTLNDSGLLQIGTGTSGPLGTYQSLLTGAFPLDIRVNSGADLNFTTIGSATAFNVYSFTWNSMKFSMINGYFDYKYETLTGGNLSLTLSGLGTAYITDLSNNNLYEPTAGTWILNGIQASGQANPTWTFNTYVSGQAVPDGGTTLVLLGLALSGLGLIRNKLS